MKNINKISVVILIAIIISSVVLINRKSDSKRSQNETVKIGLVLPLTGGAGFLGESARNSAMLALDDIGKTKFKYELVFEDDSFNPVKTVSAVNKLISADKVSAIITFGSGTSNAVAPITETAKIPRFGLASDPTSVAGEYNYIHWTPPFKEGQLLAKEVDRRGYKTISIVDTNHSGTLAVTKSVREALKSTKVKIISDDLTSVGDKDFRTIILKIKSAKPEIVLVEMFSPEIEIFAKQMKELGVNIPMTSVETFEWSNDTSLFEGMWFISDARIEKNFAEKYKAKFGVDAKPGATYVYDLVKMIIDIQEKSNQKLSAEEMQNSVAGSGSYQSPIFGKVAIDSDGFFITDATVKEIRGGKVVLVE